jgi:uncharacterized tellurite resistance protein B-like protein
MKVTQQHLPERKIFFHLGLLYFAYLLVKADGRVSQQEKVAIRKLKLAENIPDWIFDDFEEDVLDKTERQIFEKGVELFNHCTEEEKLTAFAHLYRLSEADDSVHVKEVRFLLYSLKATKVSFEEVERRAKVSKLVE